MADRIDLWFNNKKGCPLNIEHGRMSRCVCYIKTNGTIKAMLVF